MRALASVDTTRSTGAARVGSTTMPARAAAAVAACPRPARFRARWRRARRADGASELQGGRGASSASTACRSCWRSTPARARRVAHRRDGAAEAEPLLAEAREIFERLEARPWLDAARRRPARRRGGRRDDLCELRHRERRRPEVLRRVRQRRSPSLPACGAANPPGREVLRRVRHRAYARRRAGRCPPPRRARGRAPARLRPLRRPRRLHDALRERATPRRCASSSRATSTPAGG